MFSRSLLTLALSTSTLASAVLPRALFQREFTVEFRTYDASGALTTTKAFAASNGTSSPSSNSTSPSVVLYSDVTEPLSQSGTPAFLVTNGTLNGLGFDLTDVTPSGARKGGYLIRVPPYAAGKPYEPLTVPAVLNNWDEFTLSYNATDGRISYGTTTQFYLCCDTIDGKEAKVLKSGYALVFQGKPQVPEGCEVTTLYRGPGYSG